MFTAITVVSGYVGGFLSGDPIFGFLTGLTVGTAVVPLTISHIFSSGNLTRLLYEHNLGTYLAMALISGAVGAVTGKKRKMESETNAQTRARARYHLILPFFFYRVDKMR